MPAPEAASGGLNLRQLRALLELTLKQAFRPGLDQGTGARVRPLRQLVLSMGLFGGLFSANVVRTADAATFLALLFATTFVLLALAVNPDAPEVQQHRVEILHSKPLSAATLLALRLVFVLILAGTVSTCFAALPLLVAAWWFEAPLWRVPLQAGALVFGGFTMAALWLSAVLLALRWVSVDRVRRTNQTLLLLFIVGVSAASAVALVGAGARGVALSLDDARVLYWLPSSWFAGLALPGGAPLSGTAPALGALALAAVAVAAVGTGILDRHYVALVESAGRPVSRVRPLLSIRVLDRIASYRLGGRPLLHRQSLAVASAVLSLTRREEISRVRVLAPQLVAVLAFVVGSWGLEPIVVLNVLAYMGFAAVLEGAESAKQSAQPAAGWRFAAGPLPPRRLVAGLNLAVSVRFAVVPALLFAGLLFQRHRPALALALTIAYLIAVRVVLSGALLVRPAWPLSVEQQTTGSLIGFLLGLVLTGAGGVFYAVVVVLEPLVGSALVTTAALATVIPGLALAALLDWAAGRTVSRLEFLH